MGVALKPFLQRKMHRGRLKGHFRKNANLHFLLVASEPARIGQAQLLAARKAAAKLSPRQARIRIFAFLNESFSQKSKGARMGSGKGQIAGHLARLHIGAPILSASGLSALEAKKCFQAAKPKISIKTKFVY